MTARRRLPSSLIGFVRMHRRPSAALLYVAVIGSVLVLGTPGRSGTGQVAAVSTGVQSADAFVSSIGVNTHAGYFDRTYGNFPVWRDRLVESGIRNIRDGVAIGQPPVYDRLNELAALGIKTNLQLGRPFYGHYAALTGDPFARVNNPAGTLPQLVQVLKSNLLGAVSSIEGPNEYDLVGDPEWVKHLRRYQSDLYDAIKADPATRRLPVLAPSLVHRSSRTRLGVVPADLGNLHNYTGGQQETSAHLSSELSLAAKVSGGKPAWSTESNPHTAVGSSGNQPAVSERAQSIYTLRQFLEDWRKGVRRTFVYELMDEADDAGSPEMSWGLLHADGSPKPAFTTVRNTIRLLADPGPAFTPNGAAPTVSGGNSSTRSTVLQKRDGSYYVAVWQEQSVYDTDSRRDLGPSGSSVTIGASGSATFTAFRPTDSATPAGSASGRSWTLVSGAVPTIVRITPG